MTVIHDDLRAGRLSIYKLTACEALDIVAEYDAVLAELDLLRSDNDRLRAENEKLRANSVEFETETDVIISIDDDEPITAEWWQSVAGEKRNGGNWLQPKGQSPLMPLAVVLRLSSDEQDVSLWMDDRIKWHELDLPAVRTRGDVRQLVKLLGRE